MAGQPTLGYTYWCIATGWALLLIAPTTMQPAELSEFWA